MRLTGGCQCKAVRYEITGAPLSVYVCHCRECRAQSASAFGISVIVRAADFHIRQGTIGTWTRATDSGRRLECRFCTGCGTRLCHSTEGEGLVSVKGGSLDDPPDLTSAMHIWVTRKLPGVVIPPGAVMFDEEPV